MGRTSHPLDRTTDSEMLKAVAVKLNERIDACHDAEISEDDHYTPSARQAIKEEKMWLTALLMEIQDHLRS